MDPDLEPLFVLFGSTVYDCQVLESDFRFLIFLAERYEHAERFPKGEDPISSRFTNQALHKLIEYARQRDLVSEADLGIVDSARRHRNELIHSFLYSRAALVATPIGRGQVISELGVVKQRIQSAGKLLEKVIDSYLEHVGTSTERLKHEMEARWQTDADAANVH